MTVILSFVVMLLATFAGILGHDVPIILILTSVCLLAGAIVLVRRTASQVLGTSKTLCVLFFCLAAAHIFLGFLLAGLTTDHTSIRSNAQIFFAQAMFINSIGIFAAAYGYSWKLHGQVANHKVPGFPILINKSMAEDLFRAFLVAGSILMFFTYWKLGFLDYLAEPSKWPFMRYITSDTLNGSATDEWLVNRAMDLLTVSIPFILIRSVKRAKFLNILLVTVGYLALLLPLRRANLLAATLTFLILLGIQRQNVYHFARKVLAVAAILYVLSQCVFLLGVFGYDASLFQFLTVSSTALPEIRDLGWILSLLNGETLHGETFVQALLPLPSIASDWSSTHSLRAVTTNLIGMDQSSETGGLRLTIFGEGYINFGYLGAIAAGFLWGLTVGLCEDLLQAAEKRDSLFANYVAVICFVWVCFLIYLAGTQAAASVKMTAILILGVAWASKYRLNVLQTSPVQQT